MSSENYQSFLKSPMAGQWKRFGLRRRMGINTPLFSLYSKHSAGVGEYPDLNLLADWMQQCGMSLLQLLPLNDIGFNFTPYDAHSSFALEPMYLCLEKLQGARAADYDSRIRDLKRKFPTGKSRVDYGIKQAKLDLLKEIFSGQADWPEAYAQFKRRQKFWIKDYALFKILKEDFAQAGWETWPEEFKRRDESALKRYLTQNKPRIEFYSWLQWQCFEQLSRAKQYAAEKGVFMMGDLPFLVSRDSAEVWALQSYFKLHLAAGAPPDLYFSDGQRWGMPPYDWEAIAANGYDYLRHKLKYAENFYHLFRIDHFVGMFRLWTIKVEEPFSSAGLKGSFDPPDESIWEEHGRKLLEAMLASTAMMPCAEDLGVVPDCAFRLLEEYGIVGMDIQRWKKDWDHSADFILPENYRPNSIVTLATHDMSTFISYWRHEAGTADESLLRRLLAEQGIDFVSVQDRLFDMQGSLHGRLRWQAGLRSEEAFLQVLGRTRDQAYSLLMNFINTFNEKEKILVFLGVNSAHFSEQELLLRALERAQSSASVFSIQLLQDILCVDPAMAAVTAENRINLPGTVGEHNWRTVIPLSLEALTGWRENALILKLNQNSLRN